SCGRSLRADHRKRRGVPRGLGALETLACAAGQCEVALEDGDRRALGLDLTLELVDRREALVDVRTGLALTAVRLCDELVDAYADGLERLADDTYDELLVVAHLERRHELVRLGDAPTGLRGETNCSNGRTLAGALRGARRLRLFAFPVP